MMMKDVKKEAVDLYPAKIKADITAFTALGKGLAALNKP
jgi:hypothetical protein